MKPWIDFVWNLGPWNWLILAAMMLLLETIIPGLHFIWFGVAALILGAVLFVVPMPLAVQVFAFALLSVLVIFFARRYWSPVTLRTDSPDLNERGLQYVGRTVTVVETITRGRGRVRVGDSVWIAQGPDLPEGAEAMVTGVNGTVLIVGPAQHRADRVGS